MIILAGIIILIGCVIIYYGIRLFILAFKLLSEIVKSKLELLKAKKVHENTPEYKKFENDLDELIK